MNRTAGQRGLSSLTPLPGSYAGHRAQQAQPPAKNGMGVRQISTADFRKNPKKFLTINLKIF